MLPRTDLSREVTDGMDNNTRKHTSRSAAWERTANLINCSEFLTPRQSWEHSVYFALDFSIRLKTHVINTRKSCSCPRSPFLSPAILCNPSLDAACFAKACMDFEPRVSRNEIPHNSSVDSTKALVGRAALAIKLCLQHLFVYHRYGHPTCKHDPIHENADAPSAQSIFTIPRIPPFYIRQVLACQEQLFIALESALDLCIQCRVEEVVVRVPLAEGVLREQNIRCRTVIWISRALLALVLVIRE